MNSTRGFTLIEILAVVAITSIVALTAVSMFYSGSHTYVSMENRMDTRQNVRFLIEAITSDIKKVNDISKITVNQNKMEIKIVEIEGNQVFYRDYYKSPNKDSVFLKYSSDDTGHEFAMNIESIAFTTDEDKKIITIEVVGTDGFKLSNIVNLAMKSE